MLAGVPDQDVRVESATHLDRPIELVYEAARALLDRDPGGTIVAEPPRHVRVVRRGRFGALTYDELWLEAWGEGTGVRYKGGARLAGGRFGQVVLRGLVLRAADARAHALFAALRAALEG